MDIVAILSLVLAAVAVAYSVSLAQRVKKVERALEVPVPKKLSQDHKLKHHKKGNLYNGGAKIEEVNDHDIQKSSKSRNDRQKSKDNAPKATSPVAPSASTPTSAPEKTENSSNSRDKNGRRNNRRDNRRRFEASSEIVSNQEQAEEVQSSPVATESQTPVAAAPAPAAQPVITRPALAPRGQRQDEGTASNPTSTPSYAYAGTEETDLEAAVTYSNSTVRHGRRNTVRKSAVVEGDDE